MSMYNDFYMTKINYLFCSFAFFIYIFFSITTGCSTNKNLVQKQDYQDFLEIKSESTVSTLSLTFAGDIMAHTNVTRMKDFSLIYEDILDITQKDDLTFTNLETPVMNNKDYENYPNFNVKDEYPKAAIKAGFDVFSLANNHTNDQGLEGIKSTRNFFEKYNSSVPENEKVYYAGIKQNSGEDFTYQIIEKNGFKILFMAFTEIYNSLSYRSWFDTQGTTKKNRQHLLEKITKFSKEFSPDIFILSIHCSEPEYIRTVTNTRKNFYHELLEAGVDIVWANHPHVTQEWEVVKSDKTPYKTKFIMYSVGNTISGQRYRRNYVNPEASREYTGDSYLFQIKFVKTKNIVYSENINSILITNHTDWNGNTYIKIFNQDFIDSVKSPDKEYYQKRFELMNKIQGTTIWQ